MSINFGIVGPGSIADRKLVPAIISTEKAHFWSVTSRNLARARNFADRHGAKAENPAFDDFKEMLEDNRLDAVLVSTPDRTHAEYGKKRPGPENTYLWKNLWSPVQRKEGNYYRFAGKTE